MKRRKREESLLSSGLEFLVELVMDAGGELLLDVLEYVLDAIF